MVPVVALKITQTDFLHHNEQQVIKTLKAKFHYASWLTEFGFYDTIRWTVFTCAQKLTNSLNLPHGTKQKRVPVSLMKKLKTKKDAEKKRSSHKVRGVSPEAGRESIVKEVGLEPAVKESGNGSYGW